MRVKECAMQKDYLYEGDNVFFKHETTPNMPKDAYSMHSHNMYELLYFVKGDATHVIEDRKYKLKKGDLVLIRPSKYHFIQIDSFCDYERYDVLFSPKTKSIDGLSLLDKHFTGEDFERILTGLLCELFYLLSVTPATENTDAPSVTSPTLSLALKYINDNLITLTGVEEVAKNCFVTEGYLFRLFKNELHKTPGKYISSKRLLLAERMISDGEPPTSVYEKCGFSDYTTFYRNYRAFFGKAPSKQLC